MDELSHEGCTDATEQDRICLLTHPRIRLDDHIRLPVDVVRDVGEHAIVLGAIFVAAGHGECFASQLKLAEVAGVSRRTVNHAISRLVDRGWLVHFGRQPFGKRTSRKRRTVTIRLTDRAQRAFDGRYHALSRPIMLLSRNPQRWRYHRGRLTWAESLLLAELCSAWNLCERDEEEGEAGLFACE